MAFAGKLHCLKLICVYRTAFLVVSLRYVGIFFSIIVTHSRRRLEMEQRVYMGDRASEFDRKRQLIGTCLIFA